MWWSTFSNFWLELLDVERLLSRSATLCLEVFNLPLRSSTSPTINFILETLNQQEAVIRHHFSSKEQRILEWNTLTHQKITLQENEFISKGDNTVLEIFLQSWRAFQWTESAPPFSFQYWVFSTCNRTPVKSLQFIRVEPLWKKTAKLSLSICSSWADGHIHWKLACLVCICKFLKTGKPFLKV